MYFSYCVGVFIIFTFCWTTVSSQIEGCQQPMEVGKPQTFRYVTENTNISYITWTVGSQTVKTDLNCSVSQMVCTSVNTNLYANVSMVNGRLNITLTIAKVVNDMTNVSLRLDNSTVIQNCALQIFGGFQLQTPQTSQQKINVKPGSDVFVSIPFFSRNTSTSPILRRTVDGDLYSVPSAFYSTQYTLNSRYYGRLNLALYQVGEDELADYIVSISEAYVYNFTLVKQDVSEPSTINYQHVAIGVDVAAIAVVCLTIVVAVVCHYRNQRPTRDKAELTQLAVHEKGLSRDQENLGPAVRRIHTKQVAGSRDPNDPGSTPPTGVGDRSSHPYSPDPTAARVSQTEGGQELYGNLSTYGNITDNSIYGNVSSLDDQSQPIYGNM